MEPPSMWPWAILIVPAVLLALILPACVLTNIRRRRKRRSVEEIARRVVERQIEALTQQRDIEQWDQALSRPRTTSVPDGCGSCAG